MAEPNEKFPNYVICFGNFLYVMDKTDGAMTTMNQFELEKLLYQRLDNFYQERLKRLEELTLQEILRKKSSYLFYAIGTLSVSSLTTRLISSYLPTEEAIFADIWEILWEELTGDPDFYLKIIALMRDYPQQHRIKFEAEWDKALNRFEHDFLNNFGNSDGSINWEQLLRYNSGKEKVVWISSVVPGSVIDVQEDEGDEAEEE